MNPLLGNPGVIFGGSHTLMLVASGGDCGKDGNGFVITLDLQNGSIGEVTKSPHRERLTIFVKGGTKPHPQCGGAGAQARMTINEINADEEHN